MSTAENEALQPSEEPTTPPATASRCPVGQATGAEEPGEAQAGGSCQVRDGITGTICHECMEPLAAEGSADGGPCE